jgi:hypothetical protein
VARRPTTDRASRLCRFVRLPVTGDDLVRLMSIYGGIVSEMKVDERASLPNRRALVGASLYLTAAVCFLTVALVSDSVLTKATSALAAVLVLVLALQIIRRHGRRYKAR